MSDRANMDRWGKRNMIVELSGSSSWVLLGWTMLNGVRRLVVEKDGEEVAVDPAHVTVAPEVQHYTVENRRDSGRPLLDLPELDSKQFNRSGRRITKT